MSLSHLESYLFLSLIVQPFIVTMADEHGEHVLTPAMQDVIDGIVPGDVLYLASTEIVLRGQGVDIQFAEVSYHRAPDAGTSLFRWLIELDLIQKSTLEGLVLILLEIGGGNHDAIQLFHLLQDDILERVIYILSG